MADEEDRVSEMSYPIMDDHHKSNDMNAKGKQKKKKKQLLKKNLKADGNQDVNRNNVVIEYPKFSDGTGENGRKREKSLLKEAANIEEKRGIDEMSLAEEKDSKLDDDRAKGSVKAAEEQEGNGASISGLNPKSRYGKADHEMSESCKSKKKQRLLEEAAKADQRGVCYLSRIPPHMDHVKLRQILSQYGEIQRIYLSPKGDCFFVIEHFFICKVIDFSLQIMWPGYLVSEQMVSKTVGFKSKHFQKDALRSCCLSLIIWLFSVLCRWVEFTKKGVAKRVANMLNGEQIGGRKRSSFHYDLWNIKYLSKFKWDDLTEEIAYKNAIREQKLALEISAAKRERDFYLSKVDQSRALSSIEERIKKKQKVQQESETNYELPGSQLQVKKVFHKFQQKQPVADNAFQSKPRLSKDILAGVFGGSS
ncbi:hypothetical protein JRO89_XS01G0231000 [Xanthoceras sorbifolium]|uniref:Pre-rRNA-processing protein ESF2 n=1 Tax=Xanthoceras sorbifolium TaxID=99658 RepID=A0ABQ8IKS0_9ROSI|nr:hypothetical protein JRO89_XS01G0231000 [Xanthoceras sorbifolium]